MLNVWRIFTALAVLLMVKLFRITVMQLTKIMQLLIRRVAEYMTPDSCAIPERLFPIPLILI